MLSRQQRIYWSQIDSLHLIFGFVCDAADPRSSCVCILDVDGTLGDLVGGTEVVEICYILEVVEMDVFADHLEGQAVGFED